MNTALMVINGVTQMVNSRMAVRAFYGPGMAAECQLHAPVGEGVQAADARRSAARWTCFAGGAGFGTLEVTPPGAIHARAGAETTAPARSSTRTGLAPRTSIPARATAPSR